MLHVLYGNHRDKLRARLHALLSKMAGGDNPPERISAENMMPDVLGELLHRTALFGSVPPVVFDGALSDERTHEMMLACAKDLADSENTFILVEEKIPADALKVFKKYAASVEVFSLAPSAARSAPQKFNIFSLTDAIGRRDRKRAWVLYRQALTEGMAPEEIHSMLFWQVKTVLMVAVTGNIKNLPLKPFVVGKARGFAKNYSLEELKNLSSALVSVYHDAHRGLVELETGLERLILSL